MKTKIVRRLADLKPGTVDDMASGGGREWTAEILKDGRTLYAWMAYNKQFDTFATDNLEHARRFRSEAEVTHWIERLNIPNAAPVRIREGKVFQTAVMRNR